MSLYRELESWHRRGKGPGLHLDQVGPEEEVGSGCIMTKEDTSGMRWLRSPKWEVEVESVKSCSSR